jgi:hypothetical protein
MRQGERCLLTQEEANTLSEFPLHEIETGLADIVKTLMIAFFFGPFIPMCYVMSIIGISLYYMAEKVRCNIIYP